MTKMKNLCIAITAVILILPKNVFSQEDVLRKNVNDSGGLYLKFGPAFEKSGVSDFDFKFPSLNIEIENYFDTPHMKISGWSVGYSKSDIAYIDSGQILRFKVFRSFKFKNLEIKANGGTIWGLASSSFDKTNFREGSDNYLSYEHTYAVRNSTIPFIGMPHNAVLYPSAGIGIAKRTSKFIFETGITDDMMKIGLDKYEIKNDTIEYSHIGKWLHSPSFFLNFGLKM